VGGRLTTEVHAGDGEHGLTGPVGLVNFASGSALMVNITIPIMFSNVTKLPLQPQPFGFNILLFKNKTITVAMLVGPSPSYVERTRAELQGLQSYTVSADVFGLACHLDNEVEQHCYDDEWWNKLYDLSDEKVL
jgi:hypothetical protein